VSGVAAILGIDRSPTIRIARRVLVALDRGRPFLRLTALGALFLVSGFAALIYQIVWQRVLFTAFGVNVESVTLVVAVFMLGLGLGSLVGGRLSHRYPRRLLHLFVASEVAVGLFGIASVPLIHAVTALVVRGPVVAIAVTTCALLCVPTLFMGATLPMLVAYLHGRSPSVGRAVGLLYFVNTAGSAIASFVTVDVLFPRIGLHASTVVAAVLNFAVAGLSLMGFRASRRVYFYWIFYFASLVMVSAVCSIAVRLALKDYQIMRFVIFLNPHLDPQGSGWNILQSLTAIGSGGFHGKGFLHGTQSHYQFLPSQSTDFIFSIVSEEWGFLGGLLVFLLYLIVLLRGLSIVWSLRADSFAHLAGGGILAMLFLHLVINAGMAMGIMPVTGIPLLFLSYGGSSLWAALASVGILVNLHRRRYRFPGQ